MIPERDFFHSQENLGKTSPRKVFFTHTIFQVQTMHIYLYL